MVANLFTSYYSHTIGELLSLKIGETSVTFTSISKKNSPLVDHYIYFRKEFGVKSFTNNLTLIKMVEII